jgi:hypothetical protein
LKIFLFRTTVQFVHELRYTTWRELARVQAQRFFIEHSFREAKSECGMADYQLRRWDAWHHHMALVMLGTLFLVRQKQAGRQQRSMLSFNDLVTALAHLLTQRQLIAEKMADIICKRHDLTRKNHMPDGFRWRWNKSDKVELSWYLTPTKQI